MSSDWGGVDFMEEEITNKIERKKSANMIDFVARILHVSEKTSKIILICFAVICFLASVTIVLSFRMGGGLSDQEKFQNWARENGVNLRNR